MIRSLQFWLLMWQHRIGFGASWMNPFSVGIAQGIAGIDVFSGAGFRMAMWVVFTALGCGMTMFYAAK